MACRPCTSQEYLKCWRCCQSHFLREQFEAVLLHAACQPSFVCSTWLHVPSARQVRNLKKLFDVTDVVDDVQGVVDDTVQRTTDNLHHVSAFRSINRKRQSIPQPLLSSSPRK